MKFSPLAYLYITACVLLFLAQACTNDNVTDTAATGEKAAIIEIQVKGAETGKAYLVGFYGAQQYRADSAQVERDGSVRFRRPAGYDPGLFIAYLPTRLSVQFLLDEDQQFSLKTDARNLIRDMQVEGSESNQLFYESLRFEQQQTAMLRSIQQQLQSVEPGSAQYNTLQSQQRDLEAERTARLQELFKAHPQAFFTKYKKAGQVPDLPEGVRLDGTNDPRVVRSFREALWEEVDFSESGLINTPVIHRKLAVYLKRLTAQRADAIIPAVDFLMQRAAGHLAFSEYIVNWVMTEYNPSNQEIMDSEAIFVHMVNTYADTESATWLSEAEKQGLRQRAGEMSASLIGKPAPNVVAQTPTGTSAAINDIDAPYFTVFLYNPECEHCQEQAPVLRDVSRSMPDDQFQVYAIALDTQVDKWNSFIREYNTGNWINVFDPSNRAIYAKYFVDITPELYLVGPDRKIIAKNLKANQVEEAIELDKQNRRNL